MTCTYFAGATVCTSPQGIVRRRVMECPICTTRKRFVETWGGAWYGSTLTCLGCGDQWQDGELGYRPFQRGWREKSKARAREKWTTALSADDYRTAVRRDIESACNGR